MKRLHAIVLFIFVAFVATDIFYVATQWANFRTQDVVRHSVFWVGSFLIAGANAYYMVAHTPTPFSANLKLLLSFIVQVLVVVLLSLLAIDVGWKGYLYEKGGPTALWSGMVSVGVLLVLLSLVVGLILWSRRLSISNSAPQRNEPREHF